MSALSNSRIVFLAILVSLLLAFIPARVTAGSYLQTGEQGLFGTISLVTGDHPRAVAGETDITLDTKSGPVEFTSTVATRVRIPSFKSASVDDLGPGDSVAVLLSGGRAISILVKTELPVRTRHFTGVVISADEDGGVTIRSRVGEQITILALEDLQEIQTGELVTAVMEQDLASGGLAVTGLDRASASLERISSALELAKTAEGPSNIEVLKQRLIGNSVHHLTTMQELSQKSTAPLQDKFLKELEAVQENYSSILSQSGAGKARAEVTGIVTSIDTPGQRIIIEPRGLDEVEIAITDGTGLWRAPAGLAEQVHESWLREESNARTQVRRFGGREIRFDQLDLASRVRVWYELDTASATRVLVLPGESLESRPADALLSLALLGEAKGTVTSVDLDTEPPIVTLQDQISGIELHLSVAPDSAINSDTLPGASVVVSYDPESMIIKKIEELTQADSEASVHGVVHSFVSKVLPENFLILTVEGVIEVLNHTESTVFRRDGRRVSINEVRLGDLVRPATRFCAEATAGSSECGAERDLVVLSLKSPATVPVQGTIRGIFALHGGGTLITISNDWLELASLLVTDDTQLTLQEESAGVLGLALGQRVVTGAYDPLSSVAVRLVLAAPRSVAIKGEITAIDPSRSSISLTSRRGDPVSLFVLESTPARITMKGIPDPGFDDLRVGQQVQIGFYDPRSLEALRLIVN